MTDDLERTLRDIASILEHLGRPFMLVGSVAALAHGRSRATQDFDVVVELDRSSVRQLLAHLPGQRFYVSEQAASEALAHQTLFNIIDLETGWKVDIVPRKSRPFSREEMSRRQTMTVLSVEVPVATIEDTIVAKLEWAKDSGSARQLEDVRELVALAGQRLDRDYIERWALELDVQTAWHRIAGA